MYDLYLLQHFVILHCPHVRSNWPSLLLQHNISKLLRYFWSVFRGDQFSAPHKVMLRMTSTSVCEASARFFIYVEFNLILLPASQFHSDKWASKKSGTNLTKRQPASFARSGKQFLHAVCMACNLPVQRMGQDFAIMRNNRKDFYWLM